MTDNTHIDSLEQLETQLSTSLDEVREQLNQSRKERDIEKWNALVPKALAEWLDKQPSQELVLNINDCGSYLWFRVPLGEQMNKPEEPDWLEEAQQLQKYGMETPRINITGYEALYEKGLHTGYKWALAVEGPATLMTPVIEKMPRFKLADDFDRLVNDRIKMLEEELQKVRSSQELGHKVQVTKKEERECPF